MTSFGIRKMRWWDIPKVENIERANYPGDAWSTDQFWRELAAPTRTYFVATDDSLPEGTGEVVGYGGIAVIAPDSDLQTLAVEHTHQGLGLGRRLLDVLVSEAAQQSASSMMLEVRATNDTARALYESFGFDVISRRQRYYPNGDDALIMRCRPIRMAL